ncbi:hypothetical protein [Melissospora conviva]|uniref:hypothetical protein n=1 Tax=Melissospora conviva TaxID=3388432 RepID=UPI003C2A38CB
MWPWRRRSAPVQHTPQETAAPATRPGPAGPRPEPPGWPELPPIQRTFGTDALTIRPDRVTDTLAAWQNPSYLQPLGHTVGAGEPAGLLRGFAVPVSAEPSPAVQRSTQESPLPVGPVRPQPAVVSRLTTAPQQGLAVALPAVAYAAPAPTAQPDFAPGEGGAGAEPVAGSEPDLRDATDSLPASDDAATTSIAPPIGETPLITMPEPPVVQRSAGPGPDPGGAPLPRRLGLGEPIVAPSWPPGLPATAAPTPVVSRQAAPDGGVPPPVPSPPGPSYPKPAPAPGLARPLPELPVVGSTAGSAAGTTPPVTVARLIGDRPAQLLSPDQDRPSSFTPAPLPPRVQRIQWDRGPAADPGPASGRSGHAASWTGSTTDWTGQPATGSGQSPAGRGDSTGSVRTAVATVQGLRETVTPGSWPTRATPVAGAVGTESGPLLFGPTPGATPGAAPGAALGAALGAAPGAALPPGAFIQRTPESMPPAAAPGTPSPLTAAAATPPGRPLTLARAVVPPAAASPGVLDRFFTLQRADGDGQGPAAVPEPAPPPPSPSPSPSNAPSPTGGEPGGPGGTGATGAARPAGAAGTAGATAAANKAMEPEELLKKLFDPLLRRLKTELRLDRERHGLRNGPG